MPETPLRWLAIGGLPRLSTLRLGPMRGCASTFFFSSCLFLFGAEVALEATKKLWPLPETLSMLNFPRYSLFLCFFLESRDIGSFCLPFFFRDRVDSPPTSPIRVEPPFVAGAAYPPSLD